MSTIAQRFIKDVALVTGAGSGIGEAAARRFAAEGAAVAVIDINATAATQVAQSIVDAGGRASAYSADVRSAQSLDEAVATITKEYGEITVVFTAAGVAGSKIPSHELPDDAWFGVLDINLTGTFFTIRAALPSMLRGGGGSIVTCGSTSSFVATLGGGMAPYRASKGGVKMLTQTLAMEYASKGIRVNCVCPGAVVTGLKQNTATLVPAGVTDSALQVAGGNKLTVPMGRYGEVNEIASVAAFLASSDASYITGQSLLVDGGVTAE
ncbi:NAD(P)-dependent dehydrogenase (short-subunit alcohol dehydrogenase family) [Leucobacter exalbidus]|uniref:NAD(P)-dependent dehydrogenase (Short-subunit alcohol dehydrogenase family) n=1 Tax=Leucobacter exalbidus TaxID=662960 RepID=A0A940T4Y9_9MICO|nr:SDR family NAD(P)-dependent oxidoreductase [Leucobacter exalbidus]MBP1327314.1 NAD(P)-dependent dehydrogenase (short-subunit alcohol dehydrogenase family) [Leucobacter exalbidus]